MPRKNMFEMNVSTDDTSYECDELLIRQLDARMAEEKKKIDGKLNRHINKMFDVFSVGFYINGAAFALGIILLCYALVDLLQGNTEVLGLIAGGIVSLIVAIAIYIYRKKVKKPHAESKEYKEFSNEMDRFYDLCARSLNVHENAIEVEIYTHFYKEENGVRKNFSDNNAYINESMKIFEEDEKLCIYCADSIWGIPIASIEEIVEINEDIFFSDWDKDVPYDRGEYMQYRIEELEDGDYKINGYYSIRFSCGSTPYELLVPKYEIEHFKKIIKL